MHPYATIALRAARDARHVLSLAMDRLDELSITEKAVNDFVSNVDRDAETVIAISSSAVT